MKNLNSIVDKIEKNIDSKDKIREKALRSSRDIIINCRKAIQKIHQKKMKEAKVNIKQASDNISKLYKLTEGHPELYHAGFVENAAQELVEASCLFNIMNGKELPDPDELQTTYSSYLMGLCDVIGELRRKILDTIMKGDFNQSYYFLEIMENIYDAILRFDYPSSLVPTKRKQDISRSLIEKTRGELAVASCEQRIDIKTNELKKFFDSLNSNSN